MTINPMNDLRLYMFQCGILRCKVHNIKMNQGLDEPYAIPVPWFLIRHPQGNVVIDGGNAVECATQPHEHWGAIVDVYYPEMTAEQGCVNQLQRLGIDPASVTYVLQSHLHLDHTGAVGRFPNAVHVVQRVEYEYAFTPGDLSSHFQPECCDRFKLPLVGMAALSACFMFT